MAEAVSNTIVTVTLTLSGDEAATLAQILGIVGGDMHVSARQHADTVAAALHDVGFLTVAVNSKAWPFNNRNSISFKDGTSDFYNYVNETLD